MLARLQADFSDVNAISSPIFQTCAFRAGDPHFYIRSSHPNLREVEEILTRSSGMAAIDACVNLLGSGEKLVIHSLIYGVSYRFLGDHCKRVGVRLAVADLSKPQESESALTADTRMVFLETPTNPFLKTVDIRDVARRVRRLCPRATIVVDNTWATPLFQNPLQLGADIAVYSCSKSFSGHNDLIAGAAVVKDLRLLAALRKRRLYAGAVPDPFSAWLLRRSLQTLDLRLERHVENTRRVANFLRRHPEVETVYFPCVDGRQLRNYGGMLFMRLKADRDGRKARRLAEALRFFDHGTSLGTVVSAVAIPYTGSHQSLTDQEKAEMGLDRGLIRLSIGVEAPEDLIADLNRVLGKAPRKR